MTREPLKVDPALIYSIAKRVSYKYSQVCWWADRADLIQAASEAIIKAQRTFDPEHGTSFEGYATQAASKKLIDHLWSESSPLSGGMHNPRKHIAGVHRANLDDFAPTLVEERLDPGDVLDDVQWQLRVRRQLRKLCRATRDGDLAVEVLLRGASPGVLAAQTGRDVSGAVELVRRKVKTDAVLYKLYRRKAPMKVRRR